MLIFLKLYLSHLVADFLLQPDRIANNKRSTRALLEHSGIHVATALVIVNLDLSPGVVLAIMILALAHAVCDYLKARFTGNEWAAFTVDQLVHLLFISIAAVCLTSDGLQKLTAAARTTLSSRHLFLFLCAYIAVVFGGDYFVQKITSHFMRKIDKSLVESKPGLPAAGKYIGWLERSLILTFLVTGNPQGIGLLIAAKALTRYPEIKDDKRGHFAEYFLIGTLTSVSLALFAGWALLKLRSQL
ncbi:MAG TPA: DUF3307 domain-containing protein [Blastocatellia bacterium]|nr:DUF3307 domain-containing protein [Blastocatellia bacterium]